MMSVRLIQIMGEDDFLRYLTGFFEKTPPAFNWNNCGYQESGALFLTKCP